MYIALPCIGGIYMYMYVHTHLYILYVHMMCNIVTSPHLMSRGQITRYDLISWIWDMSRCHDGS